MTDDLFDGPLLTVEGAPAPDPVDPLGYGLKYGFDTADIKEIVDYYKDDAAALEWLQLVVKARTENIEVQVPERHCKPGHTGVLYPDGRVIYEEVKVSKTAWERAEEAKEKLQGKIGKAEGRPVQHEEIPIIPTDLLPNSESAAGESNRQHSSSSPLPEASLQSKPAASVEGGSGLESNTQTSAPTVPEFGGEEFKLVRERYHAFKAEAWEPVTEADMDFVANWFAEVAAEEERIKSQYERRMKDIERRRKYLEWKYLPKLEAWAKQELKGKKQRYIDLPSARLQFRKVAAHWKISDENLLRGWLSKLGENAQAALKVFSVTLWKWEDIKLIRTLADKLKAEGKAVPGLEWVPDRDNFTIDTDAETGNV